MNEDEQNTEATTAPEAATTPTPPPQEQVTPEVTDQPQETDTQSSLPPEGLQKELERARKEAASYREKLRAKEAAEEAAAEAARRKSLTAEQRAQEAEQKAEAAVKAAEERVAQAERRAALTGIVADANAALKLLDPEQHLNDDGTVNTEALLASFPFLAVTTPQPGKTPAPGAGGSAPKPTSIADLGNLTPEEFEKRRAEIYAGLRK